VLLLYPFSPMARMILKDSCHDFVIHTGKAPPSPDGSGERA
jgi:hypothetical protein